MGDDLIIGIDNRVTAEVGNITTALNALGQVVESLDGKLKGASAKAQTHFKGMVPSRPDDSSLREFTDAFKSSQAAQLEGMKTHMKTMQDVVAQSAANMQSTIDAIKSRGVGGAHKDLPNTFAKTTKEAGSLSSAFKKLKMDGNDVHSMARGLASGFNLLWLTWGNLAPLLAGAAISHAFVESIKSGAKFETTLMTISELAGATQEEMQGLKRSLLDLGTATIYGPLEAAKGLEILMLAGLSANDAIAALGPTLRFAAAGGVDMTKAAETTVAVATAYGYTAKQFETVQDIITKTAADSMASVSSMSESFKTASVVAQQYNLSLEDTSAALGSLAQIGIVGQSAGTAYRNFYTEITKTSGAVGKTVKSLGIDIRDSFKDLKSPLEIMKAISLATVNMTKAEQDAVQARLSNERGGKQFAATLSSATKAAREFGGALLEQAAEAEAAGDKNLAASKRLEAMALGYDKIIQKSKEASKNAAGLNFLVSLEKSLTTEGAFKTFKANIEKNLVKAFDGVSDKVYLFETALNNFVTSQEFTNMIGAMVSGLVSLVEALASAAKFLFDHKEAVGLVAVAYVGLGVAVSGGLLIANLVKIYETLAGFALLSSVAGSLGAFGTAVGAMFASVGLGATGLAAALGTASTAVGAFITGIGSAILAASPMLAGFASSVAVGMTALAPLALAGITAAVIGLTVGLVALAAKWAFVGESAEEANQKQRDAIFKDTELSAKAKKAKIDQFNGSLEAELIATNTALESRRKGETAAQAADKVYAELARHRVNEYYGQMLLLEALMAKKEEDYLLTQGFYSRDMAHAMAQATYTVRARELEAQRIVDIDQLNSKLAKMQKAKQEIAAIDAAKAKAGRQKVSGDDSAPVIPKADKANKAREEQLRLANDNALKQIESRLKSEISLYDTYYTVEKKMLDRKHDNGLISEAEYQNQQFALIQASENKKVAAYEQASVKYMTAFAAKTATIFQALESQAPKSSKNPMYANVKAVVDGIQKELVKGADNYKAYLEAIAKGDPQAEADFLKRSETHKTAISTLVDAMKEAVQDLPDGPLKKLATEFLNAAASAETFGETTNNAIKGISAKVLGEMDAMLGNLSKAFRKLSEESQAFWAKERVELEKQGQIKVIEDQYRNLNESVFSFDAAAKASALARVEAVAAYSEEIRKAVDNYQLASGAVDNWATQQGSLIAAGYQPAINTLNELISLRDKAAGLVTTVQNNAATGTDRRTTEAFDKVRKEQENAFKSGIADALEAGILEGGKAGSSKLKDFLKAEFRKLVLRPIINASVDMAANFLGFGGSGGATGGTGSAAGSFASSALGSTLFGGSTLASIGSSIGTGFMATVSGQSIGAAATAYSAAGQTGVATGLQAGAAIPYVAAALAAAAALGLFRSTKTVSSGLMGTVGEANDVTGYDLRRKSGYLFGGPDYSIRETALDAATSKSITDAVALISSGSRAYADALGLGTQALTGFTTTLGSDLIHPDTGGTGISFKGLNAEQITAKIQTELAKVGDAYAQRLIGTFTEVTTTTTSATDEVTRAWDAGLQDFVDTIVSRAGTVSTSTETTYTPSEFAREGETAGQTLTRLATSLATVNGLWHDMGTNLLSSSLAGGDAASRLVDAAGGMDALKSSMSGYYDAMYSEEEKRANTTRLYTDALHAVNLAVPATIEAYRQQVAWHESIAATEPGAAAALATLYAVAPAFASVNQAVADVGDVIDRTTTDISSSLQKLQSDSQSLARELLVATGGDVRAFDTAGYTAAEIALYDYNAAIRAQITLISDAKASYASYFDTYATAEQKRSAALGRVSAALGMEIDTVEEYRGHVDALVAQYGVNSAEVLRATGVAADFGIAFPVVAEVVAATVADIVTAVSDIGGYLSGFYTEAERTALQTAKMQQSFAALGLTMPTTNADFRQLVEAQDLTTQSGIATYNALIGISGAFAALHPLVATTVADIVTAVSDIGGYLSGFYTEAERTGLETARLQQTFTTLGIAMPTTNAGFRQLVEAQDLTTQSGVATYNTLIGISGAFATLHPMVTSAAEVIETLDAALASLRASGANRTVQQIAGNMLQLEEQLFTLANEGNNAALRQRTLSGLSAVADAVTGLSERDLQSMVWAFQDAQSAVTSLTTDIARLDQVAAQASTISNSLRVMMGGTDNTEANLWSTVNNTTASAEDRLTAVSSLMDLINTSISADTTAAQAAADALANTQREAAQAQEAMFQSQIDNAQKLVDLGKQLRDYVQGLLVGNLSALTPAEQLAVAQREYRSNLAGAQTGDEASMSNLQGSASTYLELARSFDPEAYNTGVFGNVVNSLSSLSGRLLTEGQRQIAISQSSLNVLQSIGQTTTNTATQAQLSNVISATNMGNLEILAGITAQIQADTVIAKAQAQAQLTLENERMNSIRDSLAVEGVISTSLSSLVTSLSTTGTLNTSAVTTAEETVSLREQQATESAALIFEIRSLNARIVKLEAVVSLGLNATSQVIMTSSATNAAIVAEAVQNAVFSNENAPTVA